MLARMTLAIGLIAMISATAAAQDPSYFPRGTWTATGYGTYIKSFTGQEAKMGSGAVGVGYYLFDNISLNAELSGYYDSQPGPDSRIFSGDLLLRNHLFHSGRFSFFLDGVAGITYADRRTPYPLGTHYNYIVEPGIGLTYQLHDNLHLIGGVRYFHLSNAHLEGPIRNPSINGTQAYVGLMWKF
jgi:opacity protein-like surface antigen